jgi:hypothetical protein
VEPGPGGADILCTPAALGPFRVTIDATRPDPTSGEWLNTGEPFSIAWPAGFKILSTPTAAIVDPDGSVVVRNGEVVRDAAGNAGDPVVVCGFSNRFYELSGQERDPTVWRRHRG